MILHNRINEKNTVNNIKIEKVLFFSPLPESHLYYSTSYNNDLYFNVSYNRILNIGNGLKTEDNIKNADNAYCNIILNSGLTSTSLITYKPSSTNTKIQNFCIKSDSSGNTYHIGYSSGDTSNNTGCKITFNTFLYRDLPIIVDSRQYYSHIIKFFDDIEGENYEVLQMFITGETYRSGVFINDFYNMNGNNYINVTSDKYTSKDYIQIKNFDNSRTNILMDDKCLYKTSSIIKFDDDFNLLWYKKLYGATTIDNQTYYQNSNIETTSNITSNSFHIVGDDKNNIIYSSINGPSGNNFLFSTDGQNQELLIKLTNDYGCFIISKIDTDGNFYWNKPIYLKDNTYNNYIHKIIYNNNSIYLLLKTYNNIIIDNNSYGIENKLNIFVIKIDKDSNLNWVKILTNNDDTITDMIIYNDMNLYISCYYSQKTKVDSYNLNTNGIGSYITNMDINNGDFLNVINKTATSKTISPVLKIKTLNIINKSLFVGGDLNGSAYIGGKTHLYYKSTSESEFFVEEIKIKTI